MDIKQVRWAQGYEWYAGFSGVESEYVVHVERALNGDRIVVSFTDYEELRAWALKHSTEILELVSLGTLLNKGED